MDLQPLSARTAAQQFFLENLQDSNNKICFGLGVAGSGKTLLAIHEGLKALKNRTVEKLLYIKPLTDFDGLKGVGFLPGDINEKLAPLLLPLIDNVVPYVGKAGLDYLLSKQKTEPVLLQDLRGRSLNRCWIVADEMQNSNCHAMKMLLTRIGLDSKMVILGDPNQIDCLRNSNGLSNAVRRLADIDGVSIDHFCIDDIVRNGIIKQILLAYSDVT